MSTITHLALSDEREELVGRLVPRAQTDLVAGLIGQLKIEHPRLAAWSLDLSYFFFRRHHSANLPPKLYHIPVEAKE
jgi:hypothetical protein